MTKSVIFHPFLVVAGGSERITLEEERFLRQNNFDTTIITFEYKDVFDHAYQPQVKIIHSKNKSFIPKVISRIRQLRRLVKEINPDVIDVCTYEGCLYMYFATLFTQYKYFAQIPSSGYDEIDSFGKHLVSYGISGRIFKSGYKKIRLSSKGHYENLPEKIGDADAIIIHGGFGARGVEGKVASIKYARLNKVPYLGICYGLHWAVIEIARNV